MIVLSPLEDDCTTWPEAVQFATEHQVRLPTPEELIWLRVNMPEAFLPEWYWSSEGLRGSRRPYATAQNFRGGRQYPLLKTEEIRVRFVQLNPLDNPAKMSILSQTLEI